MKFALINTWPLLAIILSMCWKHAAPRKFKIHPEVNMSFEERIQSHGYPVERYEFTTKDDYIITAYRVRHGLQNTENKNRSAVLLVHGMGGTPQNFIIIGPKKSLPYYLADRGYEVWFFCARGNDCSPSKHKKYDWNKDSEYWEYSLHQIAVYDLTATIDFILNHTGQKKLSLIGHSAAGNEFFIMFSEKPEYNDKVKIAISWASSPILKRMDYPLALLMGSLSNLFKNFGENFLQLRENFPTLRNIKPVVTAMCADPFWQKICILATYMIGSHKSYIQSPDDIQIIASNIPRLSNQIAFHFADNFYNGAFNKFDYGPKKNMLVYGQRKAPAYNLSAAVAPTAFFLGPADSIINKGDIYEAVSHIPNTVSIFDVPYPKFTHTDFIFGRNATEMVYEPCYRLLNDIDNGIVLPPIKIPQIYD